MKSIWKKKCKPGMISYTKFFLIMIGILFFIDLAFTEDAIKPEPDNPLLKNIRVTRSWSPTGSCISTLDAKWTEPESYPEASILMDVGNLQVIMVQRHDGIWDEDGARIYGVSDSNRSELLSRTKPLRDLIDLAISAEVDLTIEWWDTFSQYRILFTDAVAADIDKLNGYIVEMLFKANKKSSKVGIKNKSSEWTDDTGVSDDKIKMSKKIKWNGDRSRRYSLAAEWADGRRVAKKGHKGFIWIEYIRPTAGFGLSTIVLNPYLHGTVPRILDKDVSPANSSSWFRVGIIRGRGIGSGWAPKAKPTPGGPLVVLNPLGEMECFDCPDEKISRGGDRGPNWVAYPDPHVGWAYSSVPGGTHGRGDTMLWSDPDMIAAENACPVGCSADCPCGCQAGDETTSWSESRRNEI